jgi:PHP family Zn ribbon phosphoesterase
MFHADLHIHSKFSRACSRDCDIPHLAAGALRKGISVVGTGDFTHPAWADELKDSLVPGRSPAAAATAGSGKGPAPARARRV